MMQRKVTYRGEPKQLSKGFGIGLKVEGIEDYINFWGFTAEDVSKKVPCKVGDWVEVEFHVKDGRHNGDVVRLINPIPEVCLPEKLEFKTPEIKTADKLDEKDEKISKGIQEAERIFEALQSTKIYDHIKDNKEAVVELVRAVSWYL